MIVNGSLVAVAGSTGRQGGAVARRLLADGWTVRALTRDPTSPGARALADAGAEVQAVDMADPAALKPTLDGAYGVVSVQPASGAPGAPPDYSWQDEVAAGRNVADAAASAGVRHLVYSSANSAQLRSGIRPQITEAISRATGRTVPYVRMPMGTLRESRAMQHQVMDNWARAQGCFT
ncbi:NmrA family NAD(P)-binding protein [Streptomyces nigrescens]